MFFFQLLKELTISNKNNSINIYDNDISTSMVEDELSGDTQV